MGFGTQKKALGNILKQMSRVRIDGYVKRQRRGRSGSPTCVCLNLQGGESVQEPSENNYTINLPASLSCWGTIRAARVQYSESILKSSLMKLPQMADQDAKSLMVVRFAAIRATRVHQNELFKLR